MSCIVQTVSQKIFASAKIPVAILCAFAYIKQEPCQSQCKCDSASVIEQFVAIDLVHLTLELPLVFRHCQALPLVLNWMSIDIVTPRSWGTY